MPVAHAAGGLVALEQKLPVGHAVHTLSPRADHQPAAHGVAGAAGSLQAKPAGQAVHLFRVEDDRVPSGHIVHKVEEFP